MSFDWKARLGRLEAAVEMTDPSVALTACESEEHVEEAQARLLARQPWARQVMVVITGLPAVWGHAWRNEA